MKRRLIIFDTTLREGEQAPGCTMFLWEKVALARKLEELNVDIVEAGFAAASPGDFAAIQAVSRILRNTVVSSLCRAVESDIDAAVRALEAAKKPRVHIVLGTSEIHLRYKLRMSRRQARNAAVRCIQYALKNCADVQFTAEDAGRTVFSFLREIVDAAIDAGASTINLSDTVGYCMPDEFARIIRTLIKKIVNLHYARLSVHVHNDLGQALASTLAAVNAGAEQVECTLNGLGDRAGICALEELVNVIDKRADFFPGVYTNIKKKQILPACRAAAKYSGMPISFNKPVIGSRMGNPIT